DSTVVPNVFDFATPPALSAVEGRPGVDDFNADLRESIGLHDDDLFILQPTRVVARKGIELSIELLRWLDDPRCKLVITHRAGDEGLDYLHTLRAMADEAGVDLRYEADRFDATRRIEPDGRKVYALWDAYVHADFVTYPSLIEGFGNALIEAVYFRCPALVNRYPVYAADIGPLGFDFVEIDGKISDNAVAQVRELLADLARRKQMVEHNYRLGQEHLSFEKLEELLQGLLEDTVRFHKR
ncbi:MAG: glycosyltransferase family 4 protein, partial [Anaerolineae bacterium]